VGKAGELEVLHSALLITEPISLSPYVLHLCNVSATRPLARFWSLGNNEVTECH